MIEELKTIWNCGLTPGEFYGFIVTFIAGGTALMYCLAIKIFRRK